MDEVAEQEEIARELSDAISSPAGFGDVDEVTSGWAMRVVSMPKLLLSVKRPFLHPVSADQNASRSQRTFRQTPENVQISCAISGAKVPPIKLAAY